MHTPTEITHLKGHKPARPHTTGAMFTHTTLAHVVLGNLGSGREVPDGEKTGKCTQGDEVVEHVLSH